MDDEIQQVLQEAEFEEEYKLLQEKAKSAGLISAGFADATGEGIRRSLCLRRTDWPDESVGPTQSRKSGHLDARPAGLSCRVRD